MKKLFFILLALNVYAADYGGTLIAKVIPYENTGYFILSDGSFWKTTAFVKRWRTLSEWWSGEELPVPANFECQLQDWNLGDEFEIYDKNDVMRGGEANASNEEALKQCRYVLFNPRTEKALFATPLEPRDFIDAIYSAAHDIGYANGYSSGYSDGYSSGKAAAAAEVLLKRQNGQQ